MTSLCRPSPGQDMTRACVAATPDRRAFTAAAPAVEGAACRAAVISAALRRLRCPLLRRGGVAAGAGAGPGQAGARATAVRGGAADGRGNLKAHIWAGYSALFRMANHTATLWHYSRALTTHIHDTRQQATLNIGEAPPRGKACSLWWLRPLLLL